MPTVSRRLPERPHLDVPKREARELLKDWRAGQPKALERIRRRHPKFETAVDSLIKGATFRLSDAQLVVAREYGFSHWAELKERISAQSLASELGAAIRADDRELVMKLLREKPKLIHVPVRSGDWGPPMSHAANLGRLEIIKAVAELGARDFQHAFDRALLQGKLECARWLHEHGGKLTPGIIMGACETLNAAGFKFLLELDAPLTDGHGNRIAPLAMVLETYSRNPEGKHEMLELFAGRGYELPDTPMMAFHRGRVEWLKEFLRADAELVPRRFSCREIYPPELGCADNGRSGLHGTPVDGTTLLHLAIDFDEREIFELLLAHGADVNARAKVDAAGFGGHTPLFNAMVSQAYACGWQRYGSMIRTLLERGASPSLRASLRKFLDWQAEPGLHEAREVTAAEWGRTFPWRNYVNEEGLRMLEVGAGRSQ